MSQNNIDMKDLIKGESELAEEADSFSDNLVEPESKKKKNKKKKIIISAVAIVLVAGIAIYIMGRGGSQSSQTSGNYINYTVENRDISLQLSGTGTLQPANSYTITTLISGDILNAPFEEGDIVEKDMILYEFDSSDVSTNIQQAEISLSQSRRSYEQKLKSLDDLKIKANGDGKVVELLVDEGDKVTSGQTVATIRNSAVMSLVIPFGSDDVDGFFIGQSAEVTLDGSFERLSGTISKISGVEERLDGNMLVKNVTIDVFNPGGIATDQAATAMVGEIACNGSGTFKYEGEYTVKAETSGDVIQIHVEEGQNVIKNQLIITLENDTVTNDVANSADSVLNSELSLESRYDQLDSYMIKSPIAGTIIEKNYKEGDSLESGKSLCTIFDLSYLTMTLNVDELDVSKVKTGQEVTVTAEALPGRNYNGYITKVNINGTTANGVTSYPVTIRIDETDELLPGMNVQASIIVSSSTDVAAIPISALVRGNRVLVKTDEESVINTEGTRLPAGFAYVEVTPGISDDDYIEIKEVLNEGDIIAYIEEAIPSTSQFGFGPTGGAPQGGGSTPQGGGGMPQGGGNTPQGGGRTPQGGGN